ncbi:MAG: MBL fold metallo-hydrolase [Verrucomicrobiales bacterium]|nr:MBL fold metallo-hydrolase [Verrucomicrobiales bacterium]
MIEPVLKDEALLEDVARAGGEAPDALHVRWLGQSGFLLEWNGCRVLLDPYLSDSLTRKYAATDKPHVRMTARCVDPGALTGIQFVTASHAHTDHLDGETLRAVAAANPGVRLLFPGMIRDEVRRRLEGAEVEEVELNAGDEAYFDAEQVRFCGVTAAHNEVVQDDYGRSECVGFLLQMGEFRIYHSGDTLWHEGLLEKLLEWRCDLMLLPINGNKPERRVAGNLNGTEAAALARAGDSRWVVPCHYEMFEFNTESPAEFVTACERLGQPHRVMRCGERLVLPRSRFEED